MTVLVNKPLNTIVLGMMMDHCNKHVSYLFHNILGKINIIIKLMSRRIYEKITIIVK